MTQDELIQFIGAPTNPRLRELSKILLHYKFTEQELGILHKDALAAMAQRVRRKKEKPPVQDELTK